MKRLYNRFAIILQCLLVVFGIIFYIAAHPKTAEITLYKLLKNADVTFDNVEGSLISGVTLYDISFQKAVKISKLHISYSIMGLVNWKPTIEKIAAEGVRIYPNNLKKRVKKSGGSNFIFPPLYIRDVSIKSAKVVSKQPIKFKTEAKNIKVSQTGVDIKNIFAVFYSPYARFKLDGSLKNMAFHATGTLALSRLYMSKIAAHIKNMPKSFPIELYIEKKKVKVSTAIASELDIKDIDISVSDIEADIEYLINQGFFKVKTSYTLHSSKLLADIRQSAFLTPSGAFITKIDGKIEKNVYALPFEKFKIDATGDRAFFMAKTYVGPFTLDIYSKDYRNFALHAASKPHKPNYIEHLPAIFSEQMLSMEADITAHFFPEPSAKGVVLLDGNYSSTKSFIELKKGSFLVRSSVIPKNTQGGIWENLPDTLKTEITTFLYLSKEKKLFSAITDKADLTLFEQEGIIKGWAHVGSLSLDANGSLSADATANIVFDAHIDSLHSFLKDFNVTTQTMIDAEIKSRFDITLSDTFSVRFYVDIPWYIIRPDSQHLYYGLNSSFGGKLKKNRATIDNYVITFKDRRFIQKRPSVVSLDENMTIDIEKLSLLDTLTAKGFYSLKTKKGKFRIVGDKAHYSGPEGKITADANIQIDISPQEIGAQGELFVRDALITYSPPKEYVVEDEDIVIIQDIKEPSNTKRRVNIRIYSKKALKYETAEVSADFIPDITLWKESGKPFGILGIVKIPNGEITTADKRFLIQPSEIYFVGASPVNPYLDLHILYELDFYRFNIYVSHTLAKPLFLFSSEPPMSQNDIMSYILFGVPAGEAFRSSGEPSGSIATMLLGLGLKNAIGSATGIRFDTLNILSGEKGGFGIEIGKRVGKRLRIIYRNDTVSSFVIQYKASRNIRIDIDVKETGQGVNILYVKDIKKLGL